MSLLVRTLTDGGGGMRAQADGLARAVASALGGEVAHARVSAPPGLGLLPLPIASLLSRADVADDEAHRRADIVICCGVKAQAAALSMARQQGAFSVCIQRPRLGARQFDVIIAPRHDYSPAQAAAIDAASDGKILLTAGAVGPVSAATAEAVRKRASKRFASLPEPRIGVLIGGENRAYSLTESDCSQLAQDIVAAAGSASILATASRRTPEDCVRVLADAFAGGQHFFYDGRGTDNPYTEILAAADCLLVTGESVNMLSEACSAKKPVYILPLAQKSARAAAKFRRLHEELAQRGLARFWDGEIQSWQSPGLDEAARAADFVCARYKEAARA